MAQISKGHGSASHRLHMIGLKTNRSLELHQSFLESTNPSEHSAPLVIDRSIVVSATIGLFDKTQRAIKLAEFDESANEITHRYGRVSGGLHRSLMTGDRQIEARKIPKCNRPQIKGLVMTRRTAQS
jgi:hypothetical protein